MTVRKWLILLLLTIPTPDAVMKAEEAQLLTAADLADFDDPPADARIHYGDDPLQFADLRLPQDDGPHPVAIFIHGGCWYSEYDITHSGKLTAALAASGIATWSLEYRRIGDDGGGWPGTLADVAAGADYLAEIADEYSLDPERVIAAGHSAGGHLALWLSARSRLPADARLVGSKPLPLLGVLALAPAADFDYLNEHATCEDAARKLMGGTAAEHPARYRLADPMRFPPGPARQTIVVGRHDETWTPPARRYFRMAERRGDNIRLVEAPDAGHFELIDPDSTTWPLVLGAARELLAHPTVRDEPEKKEEGVEPN